ncbi:phage head closure protein [Pisciglobus halotolerans]|uniref:Phage head-tail adaptor, putative, SPP1 family n=1 Tax=Pisciglobus halotolerans TaxID=745365 RepID=A0A1I3C370_9LACT|nr:phage head closure protein [Pisciglobus halotolerans]SFH68639.1 phage head-tail adaptor, putative, SPP1 family [Pisciglobus halotolerans]
MKFKDEERFNDGLLEFGRTETVRNAEKKIIGERFILNGSLFFNYTTIRQVDFDFYGTHDKTVDLKVKTFYVKGIEESHKVLIDEVLYDITDTDPTTDRRYLFWYLQRVGEFEGV